MTYTLVLISLCAAAVGARNKVPTALWFIAAGILLLLDQPLWIAAALAALICSSRYFWREKKLFLLFNLVIALAAGISAASWMYHISTGRELAEIYPVPGSSREVVTRDMTDDLPLPVRRWIEGSGVIGREMIHEVELTQQGRMRLTPEQERWAEVEAVQYFNVQDPAFSWRVETSMMGLPVAGRDLFTDGRGSMEIRLLSLIPVVNVSDHRKLNESTLQRYLGEILWFPTAALQEYISWERVDDYTARAVMRWGGTEGSALFSFNESGEPVSFTAWRYRDIEDEEPFEWTARVHEYRDMQGIKIPTKLSATWVLDEGKFTWYEFEVRDIMYR